MNADSVSRSLGHHNGTGDHATLQPNSYFLWPLPLAMHCTDWSAGINMRMLSIENLIQTGTEPVALRPLGRQV